LYRELAAADIVVSTTGAPEPVVSLEAFRRHVAPERQQRPLFILDLAVPRDFDPAISDELGTYLYSIEDLAEACERNRRARSVALPDAERIVKSEARGFLAEARHRATAPVIAQLREGLQQMQELELERLYRRLPELDERARQAIRQFSDRIVGKILHPPLTSLRDESQTGSPHKLLDALRRLFQLKE
jgi:glutamyl-tRNA reductase